MKDRLKMEKYFLLGAAAAIILMLAAPLTLRLLQGNELLMGEDSYYHARMAKEVVERKSISFEDGKIQGGRAYRLNPYHATLGIAGMIVGFELASKILPILLGAGTVTIFSLLLRYFGLMIEKRILIIGLLGLTPAFAYSFSASGMHGAAIFLILLGIYLGVKQEFAWKICSLAAFMAASSFSIFHSTLVTAILILYFLSDIRRHTSALWGALAVVLFAILASPPYIFSSEGIIRGTISDLGATAGFSIFIIMLSAIGMLNLWRRKARNFFIYAMLLFLGASILIFGSTANLYLAFILAIFSCFGLSSIIERHWEMTPIRNIAVAILLIGLAASQATFANRLAETPPGNEIAESMLFLKSQEPGTVLSHYSNGFWIEYLAEKPVVEDGLTRSDAKVFYSRDLEAARKTMEKNSVRYILIDPEMKSGEVWNNPEEGLLFLFRNNQTFRKIYDRETEIWEVS